MTSSIKNYFSLYGYCRHRSHEEETMYFLNTSYVYEREDFTEFFFLGSFGFSFFLDFSLIFRDQTKEREKPRSKIDKKQFKERRLKEEQRVELNTTN